MSQGGGAEARFFPPVAYKVLTKKSDTKKANHIGWPKLLILLVGPHGLEPWTKGL